MAKDPGFIFYPGDYLRDTQTLSEKTQVAYDRIMCEHMRNICISKKQLKFFTKRLSEDEFEELEMVLTEINGGVCIDWVVESINKRRAYSESRRKNREGSKEKDMLNTSKTYDKHMEDENVIDNRIKREEEFKSKVREFKNHPASMLEEFIDYWTEPNKSGSKMLWEMKPTWDLKRRLSRWAARAPLKAPQSKKLPTERRTGKPMTQIEIREFYKEHGKYPNQ